MLEPAIPDDESLRLRALRNLGLLGTGVNTRFDRVTETTAIALQVPATAITLIDEQEQWLLSSEGLLTQSIPRRFSFCGHAIVMREMLVVEDAACDSRFADNPLVISAPRIAFYAGQPLFSIDGHALGALCIIDQKPRLFDERSRRLLKGFASWAQSELNSVERERRRFDAARKRLLAPAVHQILGALTSIHGFSEFLLSNDDDESQRKELLQTIHGQANQLVSLVNELVDLFQLESMAGRDVQMSSQQLEPMLREAIAICLAADEQLHINTDIQPGLPDTRIDVSKMQQAVVQLLSNTLRHSSTTADVHVSLGRAEIPNYLAITVHDRDPGLNLGAKIDSVFEPFFRANRFDVSSSATYGLAFVKQVAELHGGSVLVVNEAGKGVSVTLLLPIPH